MTSGSIASRELGIRIGDTKNPAKQSEVNKYLDTPGLITAELAAINAEYGATGMTEDNLKTLMRYFGGESNIAQTYLPSNVYAESAYAKG